MQTITSSRDLEAWQLGMDFAIAITSRSPWDLRGNVKRNSNWRFYGLARSLPRA